MIIIIKEIQLPVVIPFGTLPGILKLFFDFLARMFLVCYSQMGTVFVEKSSLTALRRHKGMKIAV